MESRALNGEYLVGQPTDPAMAQTLIEHRYVGSGEDGLALYQAPSAARITISKIGAGGGEVVHTRQTAPKPRAQKIPLRFTYREPPFRWIWARRDDSALEALQIDRYLDIKFNSLEAATPENARATVER